MVNKELEIKGLLSLANKEMKIWDLLYLHNYILVIINIFISSMLYKLIL